LTQGISGQGYGFDGTSGHIDFGKQGIFEMSDEITIGAWAKIEGNSSNGWTLPWKI